jgi:transcriptional regulator with XRE-family HTH domain
VLEIRTLREWRQSRGLSQAQLSFDTRIVHQNISAIETGRLRPTRKELERLAAVLGIGWESIAEAEHLKPERRQVPKCELSDEAVREHREESHPEVRFLREEYEEDPKSSVERERLYAHYQQWCLNQWASSG